MKQKRVECKVCHRRTALTVHKLGYFVKAPIDALEAAGWILNLRDLKKSVCPGCNLFHRQARAA